MKNVKNPLANVKNPLKDMKNPLKDMKNPLKDMKNPLAPALTHLSHMDMKKQFSAMNPVVALNKISKRNSEKKMEKGQPAHNPLRLRNIFAAPLDLMDLGSYKLPSFSRSSEEHKFIESALQQNFVFEGLSRQELVPLVKAFEEVTVKAGEVVIQQGDQGDYFYIIKNGKCAFSVDGNVVGEPAKEGDSFGELALLYTSPRAATVTATEDTTLFRVNQKTFRFILQTQTNKFEQSKLSMLDNIKLFETLSRFDKNKLLDHMTPRTFTSDEILIDKGAQGQYFWIIEEGAVEITEVVVGGQGYENSRLSRGEHFGEYTLTSGKESPGRVRAVTDGKAFVIDKDSFMTAVGELEEAVTRSLDTRRLGIIKVVKDSNFDPATLSSLAAAIKETSFKKGRTLFSEGQPVEAAITFVKEGAIQITSKTRNETIGADGYFGEETLLHDTKTGKNGPKDPTTVVAAYTAVTVSDCKVRILYLKDMRKVVDTTYMGEGLPAPVERDVSLSDLEKHTILGAGTFGQVWLVSRVTPQGKREAYALKVQSKYELCESGQAKAVVYEKNVMAELRHPFITNLAAAFQDSDYVYMLMGLVQGGELYSVMHTETRDCVPEEEAVFYVAGIAEGLGYMHQRGYVYRDLKPENVLINEKGYPVLVDFGFAKYIEDKTYTFCGTPLYLPPEIILNRGHNWSADHWSLGVLAYEMLAGYTPFYLEGMDQMTLLREIVKCDYALPEDIPPEAANLLESFLVRDPAKRLGNLSGREKDVFEHPWFSSIDFHELPHMTMEAPYVPTIKNPLDASNFEDWSHLDDKLKQTYPKLKAEEKAIFDKF